jgi:hypothetical protein
VETPETLEQFDKYYKLDTSNWPTLDEAKQLFQTNLYSQLRFQGGPKKSLQEVERSR